MYGHIPLVAVKGDYTVVTFGPNAYHYVGGEFVSTPYYLYLSIPDSGQLDFRVEALTGYYTTFAIPGLPGGTGYIYTFFGESSGWSEIQTITMSDGSIVINPQPSVSSNDNSPSQSINDDTPSQAPDQTQPPLSLFTNPLFMLGIGVLFGGIAVAVILIILRKKLNPPVYNRDFSSENIYT
jgi:hypothetical protein